MRTVKEISDLTGISVRTLHYYDEIGLLKPTEKSDAGYRLYDDKALETLQQILFFREFDISLKEIKAVLDNPALERNQILQVQRKMLVTKKERMERLIASIDDILKGENKMDFTIFTKTEVEEMFQTMLEHMPENMRNIAIKEFGSIEQWKKHYMEVVSSEEMQKGYAKVVEWYGGKDKFLSVARTPVSKEVAESYNKRIEAILQKLIAKQKKTKEKFKLEHPEVARFEKASAYLAKHPDDKDSTKKELLQEQAKLVDEIADLKVPLTEVQEDLKKLRDIRYWVRKATPGTEESKEPPKKQPLKEVLQDKADEKKAQKNAPAQTKHRQQDMEL